VLTLLLTCCNIIIINNTRGVEVEASTERTLSAGRSKPVGQAIFYPAKTWVIGHKTGAVWMELGWRPFSLWLGWAYLAKKMQSPQPRPSQPPSNSVLDKEKMGS
jgi:hypothetical protein